MNIDFLDDIRFEEPCRECLGQDESVLRTWGVAYPCFACEGTGFVLTDFGRKVSDFLSRLKAREAFARRDAGEARP